MDFALWRAVALLGPIVLVTGTASSNALLAGVDWASGRKFERVAQAKLPWKIFAWAEYRHTRSHLRSRGCEKR